MQFEIGKFYIHGSGKMIAIHGEVETYAWGSMFVVEECIPTEHGVEHYISAIIKDGKDHSAGWCEIGRPEFMRNFPKFVGVQTRKADEN